MAEFTRWFLALFFLGVAVFYTVRILAIKNRRGASPVFSGEPFSAHFLTHFAFRIFRAAILLVCVARLFSPEVDIYLVPIPVMWHPAILLSGCVLLLGSFGLALYAHFYMGRDWHSGAREEDRARLITTGPFALSRNPMMICVQGAQLGLFLALPTLFTLVCLFVGVAAVHIQVKVEEAVLEAQHGDAYRAYRERTPRWLFG